MIKWTKYKGGYRNLSYCLWIKRNGRFFDLCNAGGQGILAEKKKLAVCIAIANLMVFG